MKSNVACLFFLSLLAPLFVFSQVENVKSANPNLMGVKDVIGIANFDRTTWSLYAQYKNVEYAPTKSEEVIKDIDTFLLKRPTFNERKGQMKEFDLINKYRNIIDTTFQGLGLLGGDQLGEFLYTKNLSLPVHFGLYGDTALSFIVSSTFIDNVYNTLKFTARQRAAKVVTTYILPSLKSFTRAYTGKEIKYFGMTCVYGSKDFSNNGALSTKAEFVAFIAPVNKIRQYVNGDITEDELIAIADIFVCDRDMVAEIKKIKIDLE